MDYIDTNLQLSERIIWRKNLLYINSIPLLYKYLIYLNGFSQNNPEV